MRLCRFNDDRLGLVEGGTVRDVTAVLDALPAYRYPLPRFDPLIANLDTLRPKIVAAAKNAPTLDLSAVKLLSPVANPGKIIAAPVNYKKHLEEVLRDKEIHHGNLINEIHRAGLFLKAGSSLVGARLDRATITSADFTGADLTDARILRPTIFTTLEVETSEAPKFTGA